MGGGGYDGTLWMLSVTIKSSNKSLICLFQKSYLDYILVFYNTFLSKNDVNHFL